MVQVRYALLVMMRIRFFVMVRIRHVGTLFEFAYSTFYVQRAAVNEDSCDRARRALLHIV